MRSLKPAIALACAWLLAACGGGSPTVAAPPAINFTVVPAVASAVPGVSFNVTVTALGTSGAVATSYAGTVRLSSTDGAAVLPPAAPLAQGIGTFTLTLNTSGAQTISATDTAASSYTGTSAALTVVTVGPASGLQVSTPATASIGTPVAVGVLAVDASGNQVIAYQGTVKLTSSDGAALLPAASTLTQGQQTFAATLKTSGPQTITATDTVTASLSGQSNPIAVSGPATHLQLLTPSAVYARAPLQIGLSALDASGNQSTGYNGSVNITSSDPLAPLPTAAVALGSGGGAFSTALQTLGPQTFTATDTSAAAITGTSAAIAVSAAPVLAISSAQPPVATVGTAYYPRRIFACYFGRCGYRTVYGFPLLAVGGIPPYRWGWATAVASSLLRGFSLSGNLITGTAPIGSVGSYQVVVTAIDSGILPVQTTAQYAFTIVNPPPPVIRTEPGPQGATLNQPYSHQFLVSSGFAPITFSESGALPTGLAPLIATGLLSGTPTAAGLFPITLHAVDAAGQDSAQAFSVGAFQHGFAPTASLLTMRSNHTATLLVSGKVLLVGSGSPAELYDPALASFAATGAPQVDRTQHTATLLCELTAPSCADPKVLIVGGVSAAGVVGSAEIYDPAAGTFTLTTGSLTTPRSRHTATLLPSGEVLIAGGVAGVAVATAERFDPSTGRFTVTTGSMTSARAAHTATLLPDGRVLLAGGMDIAGTPLATAELYNPSAASFAATAVPMAAARLQHSATLVGGKVLIAGGAGPGGTSVATAELYDPATSGFAPAAALVTPRSVHTAALLADDTVLIVGGLNQNAAGAPAVALPHAERYDPATGLFTDTGSLQGPRFFHTMTVLGASGKVLVTGGSNSNTGLLGTAELYQ